MMRSVPEPHDQMIVVHKLHNSTIDPFGNFVLRIVSLVPELVNLKTA